MFRRRRPLLRAAAVGGAAYHMGKKAQENRDEEAAEAEYAATEAESGPAGITDAGIEQLKKLSELKAQGVLTEEEFEEQKRRILGS